MQVITLVTHVLDRVLGLLSDSLSAEEAARLSTLPRDAAVDARVEELAEKANEGDLTSEEQLAPRE